MSDEPSLPRTVRQIIAALNSLEGNEGSPKKIFEKMIELNPELQEKKNLRASVRMRLQEWSSDSLAGQEGRPWKQRLDLFEWVEDGLWRLRIGPPDGPKMAQDRDPGLNVESIAYDPTMIEDAREKVLSLMTQRLGQQPFRDALLANYKNTCAVSGCRTGYVLEAAHITPYIGPQSSVLSNGILLRSDIHILYDLGLVAIEPDSRVVELHSKLKSNGSEYAEFHGKKIFDAVFPPSTLALRKHYELFQAYKEVYDELLSAG